MATEIILAGYTLSQEEWAALDAESRLLLLEAIDADGDPYDSYEVRIELPPGAPLPDEFANLNVVVTRSGH